MKLLENGTELDGFLIDECIHSGGMAHVYQVHYADGQHDPGFAMAMKVPRMTAGDGAENIVSFEVEWQIMQVLQGRHVPRFVAAGDLDRVPYLVMEYITGETLGTGSTPTLCPTSNRLPGWAMRWHAPCTPCTSKIPCTWTSNPPTCCFAATAPRCCWILACHCHAHYPDLLAERLRKAVGSPAWIAPEQVVGVRGDPRSDIFAVGVMLSPALHRTLALGTPQTPGGLRQRLWVDPVPPRKYRPELPEWLQEVVLRCLERGGQALPLRRASGFRPEPPGPGHHHGAWRKLTPTSFGTHFRRWLKAAGMHYKPAPSPHSRPTVPIVMVAVPHQGRDRRHLYSLRQAVARSLGTRPGARLACVTVISSSETSSSDEDRSETNVHRRYLTTLRQWAQLLEHPGRRPRFHVLESGDVAQALLDYAKATM